MAKVIYSLKLFLLRQEFKMTASNEKDLLNVCFLIVRLYVKAWFTALAEPKFPFSDFLLLRNLLEYRSRNFQSWIAETDQPLVIFEFFFFYDNVSGEMKRNMCK